MVYVFICRKENNKWTAKPHGEDTPAELTAEGDSLHDIEKKLRKTSLEHSNFKGQVMISHSMVTPKSSLFVCQFGAAALAVAGAVATEGGDSSQREEKKEEEPAEESESDDEMDGFALFD